jgi:hypothetical protein
MQNTGSSAYICNVCKQKNQNKHAASMGAAWPSDMLVPYHVTSRCLSPEDHDLNVSTDENKKWFLFCQKYYTDITDIGSVSWSLKYYVFILRDYGDQRYIPTKIVWVC